MALPGGAIHAVIFDCDGVLVDSEGITNRLLRDDLAQHGLDMPLEQVMSAFVGGTMEGVAAEAMRLGAALPPDWVELFYGKMFKALAAEVEAIAGVHDLLERLHRAGIACAVGSNGPLAKMDITLKRTGLWRWLTPHVYSARELAHPKPAPDIYIHAAGRLGVSPAHCVVIEDSASGARAAQAAKMRCIGFAEMGQDLTLKPHCDVLARDMPGVARLLGV